MTGWITLSCACLDSFGDATTIRFILPNVAMPKESMQVYETVYVPDPLLSMNIGVHTNGNNKSFVRFGGKNIPG
jgi:hypothetical protein